MKLLNKLKKKVKRQVIKAETSKKVRDALESVVTDGGGRNAYINGYRIGGKTGTAQKAVNGSYVEVVIFSLLLALFLLMIHKLFCMWQWIIQKLYSIWWNNSCSYR